MFAAAKRQGKAKPYILDKGDVVVYSSEWEEAAAAAPLVQLPP